MTAMVACTEKDNTNAGNGGSSDSTGTGTGDNGNPTDTTATASSYFIYDSVTYPMYNLDATHVNSSSSISQANVISFFASDTWPKNTEMNLATPAAGSHYWFQVDGNILNLEAYGSGRPEDGSFDGFYTLEGENVNGESAFSSGTYTVFTADSTGNGNAVRIELDGVLKNGKRMQVLLVSAENNGNNNQ